MNGKYTSSFRHVQTHRISTECVSIVVLNVKAGTRFQSHVKAMDVRTTSVPGIRFFDCSHQRRSDSAWKITVNDSPPVEILSAGDNPSE